MKRYPADFRERLLRAIDAGLPRAEAAQRFGVHPRTIERWQQRQRTTGSVAPRPNRGRPPRLPAAAAPALVAQLEATPDATLAMHCDTWEEATGVRVSAATMWRAIRRVGWTLKKKSSGPASATKTPAPPGAPRPNRSTQPTSSSSTRRARPRR